MTAERDAEKAMTPAEFAAELRRLADALETGAGFAIEVDGETVTIPEGAMMSVAHEREDGQVELEFQVTWTEAAPAEAAGTDGDEADEAAVAHETPEAADVAEEAPVAEAASEVEPTEAPAAEAEALPSAEESPAEEPVKTA